MDFVVMGESRGIDDFADSTSKLGSAVQINSIAIDISGSMEAMESPVHEHFSIRGFVAGMRKKNRKTCFPFKSPGIGDVDLVDYLPPLSVPEFRCWQCSSCIPNDGTKRTSEETSALALNDACTSSCGNARGRKDGLFIHSRENTDGEDKDRTKFNKTRNICVTGRHKDIPCSKGKTDTRDIEAGNSRDTSEIDPQQVIERFNNAPDASVLPHKRKPKLRYLADIMVEKRNQTSSSPRTRSSSSCGIQVASTEMESVFVSQLEVDISADVSKVAQSRSEQKRKIALGEDREPLTASFPRATFKRIKGLELDADKNSTRVESIYDPESKGDASVRLDMPRIQQIKRKKAKAIDTNKKMRQIRRDDERALMKEFQQPNNVSSANLQEQVVPVETNPGKNFTSSLYGQQMEKISDLSMAKMPEVGNDDDPSLPPRKGISGNGNTRGTVALDLSLNSFMDADVNQIERASLKKHRCIPDLNVEYSVKTSVEEEQQSTILSEKRSSPLHKTTDPSASCSYGTVGEGKRISGPKNKDTVTELNPSDDIPMEIVELLAKNQHERALGNSRGHLCGINDATKGYSAIEGVSSFPLPSRINGLKVANGNMDTSRAEKAHHSRLSSSSSPSQSRKPEYPMSASTMAGPSSIITWQELLYSSVRQNAPLPQLNYYKSCLDERHKERTVVEGKKAVANTAKLKEGRRIRSNYTSYSNDTIPAMQLLSLMDQRVRPDSSFDKRPPVNGKENRNFLSGQFFPQRSSVYSSDERSYRASSSFRVEVPQELRNSKSNEGLGECVINKNPADFSIPEVGNEFTISAKDLRHRKRNAFQEKLQRTNVDGIKRQRGRKNGP